MKINYKPVRKKVRDNNFHDIEHVAENSPTLRDVYFIRHEVNNNQWNTFRYIIFETINESFEKFNLPLLT